MKVNVVLIYFQNSDSKRKTNVAKPPCIFPVDSLCHVTVMYLPNTHCRHQGAKVSFATMLCLDMLQTFSKNVKDRLK